MNTLYRIDVYRPGPETDGPGERIDTFHVAAEDVILALERAEPAAHRRDRRERELILTARRASG